MTDEHGLHDDQPSEKRPATIVVPGKPDPYRDPDDDGAHLSEAQQVQDLGSASRSCAAIIAILMFMALLVCVFLMWAFFLR